MFPRCCFFPVLCSCSSYSKQEGRKAPQRCPCASLTASSLQHRGEDTPAPLRRSCGLLRGSDRLRRCSAFMRLSANASELSELKPLTPAHILSCCPLDVPPAIVSRPRRAVTSCRCPRSARPPPLLALPRPVPLLFLLPPLPRLPMLRRIPPAKGLSSFKTKAALHPGESRL